MKTIKAIETRYAGCHFRSRLEARHAVFFDTLGVCWEYEPQGYALPSGHNYLPDFYLPEQDLWVEVKPSRPKHLNPGGVERWTAFAKHIEDRTAMFVGSMPNPASLSSYGPPTTNWYGDGITILEGHGRYGDYAYAWCVCPSGQHYDIQFEGRGARIHCACPKRGDRSHTGDHHTILAAYTAARSARFEHGQSGA